MLLLNDYCIDRDRYGGRDFGPPGHGPPPPFRGDPYYRDGGDRFRGGPPPHHHHHHPPPPHHRGGPPFLGPPPHRGGGGGGGGDGRGRRNRTDEGPPGVSLLVRNVAPTVTQNDLTSAFSRIGKIRDVYIPRDYHSQQPKGFAFIEYETPEMAREARDEMDRFVVRGRELEVVFAQERRKTPNEMRGRVVEGDEPSERGGGGSDRGGSGRRGGGNFERYVQPLLLIVLSSSSCHF